MNADATPSAEEWIERFAAELGAEPPDPDLVRELLALAATAAHASERRAAPIACFIAGASGRAVGELQAAARRASAPRAPDPPAG